MADGPELSLQALGAIAILAGPGLRSVLIPALRSIMRILHFDQFEVKKRSLATRPDTGAHEVPHAVFILMCRSGRQALRRLRLTTSNPW
jgi:hypothetical protein